MTSSEIMQFASDLAPGCAKCGTKFIWTPAEAQLLYDQDQVLNDAPDLQASIRSLGKRLYCPPCIKEFEDANVEARRQFKIRELQSSTYREGLIPADAKNATFANSMPEREAVNPAMWKAVRAYPLPKNLWIFGQSGTGKTFSARCALNHYLANHKSAAEISAMKVQELGRDFHQEREIKRFGGVQLLLLEDLDKPAWTSEGLAALWRLIDMRCTAKTRTIITANEVPGKLREQWLSLRNVTSSTVMTMFERMLPMERIETKGKSFRVAS